MSRVEFLITDLPDPQGARRFFDEFDTRHSAAAKKLAANEGLLSDVLTIAAYSPLLAATLLQNPGYAAWLGLHRSQTGIRSRDKLQESLARFALTNSQVKPGVMLAQFRRRELLRIFLRDIRRLLTIAEITEEISNLADAILDYALNIAATDLDNRYGQPLETDEKGRSKRARLCIVSLGKLGSKELNYASDIDLQFIYSAAGETSGLADRITNREYFIKLAESVIKILSEPAGGGGAYRVDLRLRPHGSLGALALSLDETVRYYKTEARAWEKQMLIRSRASAGDAEIYKRFFRSVEQFVFRPEETVENALSSVKLSKEQIDAQARPSKKGFDVKLGHGGIREIEFIAQALQTAYGGQDAWLRVPHTLISLARLADRKYLSENELTGLFDAYEFLRRTEHILQMENGLQTHLVPDGTEKRSLVARRMGFVHAKEFDARLADCTSKVNTAFARVFGEEQVRQAVSLSRLSDSPLLHSSTPRQADSLSLHFSTDLPCPLAKDQLFNKDYSQILLDAVNDVPDFRGSLACLRKGWSPLLLEIAASELSDNIGISDAWLLQTRLAEASIETALFISRRRLAGQFQFEDFSLAVLGLGKLGSRGIDYHSDLDLVFVYDGKKTAAKIITQAEFYSRAVEIFVTALSAVTRDGSLYRVDLRLRPDGKKGATAAPAYIFLDYLEHRAAMWEWLAYVKLRFVTGDAEIGNLVETGARRIIHHKAQNSPVEEIAAAAARIRLALEKERKNKREIDIKYGSGGLLDIYFLIRFLQLRDNIQDGGDDRSTRSTLQRLFEADSIGKDDFEALTAGYEFLSNLDHYLRLFVGRSTIIPVGKKEAIKQICSKMEFSSFKDLTEALKLHRLALRSVFDRIVTEKKV